MNPVNRVLILGGYGGFGARIAMRLAAAGHEVLVAGRSAGKAEAFCGDRPGLTPLALDRADIAEALERHRPAVVVDASGPFQAMDYAVPRACIAAGVHYVDIADGRDFVCGIAALDAAAKAAGVAIVAGASSVPALSGAAVRRLAVGMLRISAIEMAISASNKATAGPAVAAAILGQVGRPLRLWRGQRWTGGFGWDETRSLTFACPGVAPIEGRRVALVDVPDLELLPERMPGRPAVTFRAGTELGFQNRALALASRAVRRRLLPSPARFAGWLHPLQRLTSGLGSDRSAMVVRLFGETEDDSRVERRWTLIADRGDGPEIPALSAPLVVARILAGDEKPGARDAGLSLALDDYAASFAGLAIHHTVEERALPSPLYARVMGAAFDLLPGPVRAMHLPLRDGGAAGEAEVGGAANPLGALIARIVGFPRAGRHTLHVHFREDERGETWTRDFGGTRFHSHLSAKGAWLVERFGPLRFAFALPAGTEGLEMVLQRWWLGPLPLPKWAAPRSRAREWTEGGRFHFDVPIALPLIGRLVHYRGWLEPTREA